MPRVDWIVEKLAIWFFGRLVLSRWTREHASWFLSATELPGIPNVAKCEERRYCDECADYRILYAEYDEVFVRPLVAEWPVECLGKRAIGPNLPPRVHQKISVRHPSALSSAPAPLYCPVECESRKQGVD